MQVRTSGLADRADLRKTSYAPIREAALRRICQLAKALVITALATACGIDRAPVRSRAVVHDSAGVTIVESPAPGPDDALGWTLDRVPLLDIGTLDGPPEHQLYRVRGALRMADGGVAVLNAGTREIRVYDAEGAHVRSMGGEGGGPGEFTEPGSLTLWPGDSLAVWDSRARRLSIYAIDGTFGRVVTFPPPEGLGIPSFSHRLTSGALAVTNVKLTIDGVSTGNLRVPFEVSLLSPEGDVVASLGTYPGDEMFMDISPGAVSVVRLPFARGFSVSGHGDETIVALNDRIELKVFGPDGTLRRIARVLAPPRPTTDADRQAYLQDRLASAPEERRPGLRTMIQEHPGPDTLPAFDDLTDDRAGNTWVRLFRSPADVGPGRWLVLDDQGALLGTAELPVGIDAYEIGPDWLLGLWTDELDVEHVGLWRLNGRPAPG